MVQVSELLGTKTTTPATTARGTLDVIGGVVSKQLQKQEQARTNLVEGFIRANEFTMRKMGREPRPEDTQRFRSMGEFATSPLVLGLAMGGDLQKAKILTQAAPKVVNAVKTAVPRVGKFVKQFPKGVGKVIKEKLITPQEAAIQAQRRGILGDTIVDDLAKGKLNTLDRFGEFKAGTSATVEEIRAAKTELAERILGAFEKGTLAEETPALQKGVKGILGVRAEAGRAVREFKVPVDEKAVQDVLPKLIKARDAMIDPIAKQQIDDMINVLSGRTKNPGLQDKLVEWATAIKLTSYRTPFRAGIGNLFGTLIKAPERFVSVGVDKARSFIFRTPQEITAREAVVATVKTAQGFKEGARAAIKSLLDENFAAAQQRSAEAIPIGGAIRGKLGKVVRLPFRAISAPDAFFRAANESGELYAHAIRQATKEGLKGEALVQRIDQLVKNKELINLAKQTARESVFQKDLGKFTTALNAIRNRFPATKLIMPFFRTPINLLKFGVERSPLGLPKALYVAFKQGGTQASEAFARVITGSAVLSGLTMYASEGTITGSWKSFTPAERDAMRRQGMQPNSIKIGNRWYSYRGLEPLSFYLSFAAEIAETQKEPTSERATKIIGSLAEDFANQPFLLGLSNVFNAVTDPDRYASRFFADLVRGTTIPVAVSDIARLYDPTIRKTETVFERLQANIPGASQKLLPQRNVWGETVTRKGALLERLSPVQMSEEKEIPLENELQRLGVTIGFPSQAIGELKMDDEEYDSFTKFSGYIAKRVLLGIIDSPAYLRLPDSKKRDMIEDLISEARRTIRDQMITEIIRHRLNNPDKEVRIQFLKEELPKIFEESSDDRKMLILEAIRRQ